MSELIEGDVYRWRWNEAEGKRRESHIQSGTLYWCLDQQAIVIGGQLLDTYWAGYRLSSSGGMTAVDPSRVELERICNLADGERIEPHQIVNYDESDVVNLTYHAGYKKHFLLRHGAKPSRDARLRRLREKQSDARRAIDSAIGDLRYLAQLEWRIENGEDVSIG